MWECENCDTKLQIRTEETIYNTYEFKNGSLKHVDGDSSGQRIFLECWECGERYDFKNDLIYIEEAPKLVQHSMSMNGNYSLDVELDEVKIRRCKG